MNPEPACAASIVHYFVDEAGDPTLFNLLVGELLGKLHHMADEARICFAKRGNKTRNAAFREALEQAAAAFARSFGFTHPATNDVVSSTPPNCPGLQAVNYYLWALQRFYERGEDRFLDLIWPQVVGIHDLDRLENGRRGVFLAVWTGLS